MGVGVRVRVRMKVTAEGVRMGEAEGEGIGVVTAIADVLPLLSVACGPKWRAVVCSFVSPLLFWLLTYSYRA